jgi:hypothetical protein
MIENKRNRLHDVGYDPYSGAYHSQHDWESPESLSHTVTHAIAALTGIELNSGPPLSHSIDPDALNRLFQATRPNTSTDDHIRFTHQDCVVTVYRDGHIVVYPPASDGCPGAGD